VSDAWTLTALVVRYGVEIEGKTLAPGEFSRSLAEWFVPLQGAHDARFLNYGVACDYDDREWGLIVDFVVEEWLAEQVLDGMPVQFSVGFEHADALPFAELSHVMVCLPPHAGACPGTRVLCAPRPSTPDELERVQWSSRTPNGNPVTDARSLLDEVRQRYGVKRDLDDETLADLLADGFLARARAVWCRRAERRDV
jgi:hypothetical protein